MYSKTQTPPVWPALAAGLLGILPLAGCGLRGAPDNGSPDADDFCLALLQETIGMGEQLVDLQEQPETIDLDVACQYLANFITLLDEGCVDESYFEDSTFQAGTDRQTFVDLWVAFGCAPS